MDGRSISHEQNGSKKTMITSTTQPSLVVNSMLTALAQSLLPSTSSSSSSSQIVATNHQQLLADLQAAATLASQQQFKKGLHSSSSGSSSSNFNDNTHHHIDFDMETNRTGTDNDDRESIPQVTQAKRRATHNAVERRRRDRINQHIQQLAKLIPDCSSYVKTQSKTAVLEKTIAYVHELRSQNIALVKQTVDAGIILHENDALRDRIRLVEQENNVLKSLLTKHSLLTDNESS